MGELYSGWNSMNFFVLEGLWKLTQKWISCNNIVLYYCVLCG